VQSETNVYFIFQIMSKSALIFNNNAGCWDPIFNNIAVLLPV